MTKLSFTGVPVPPDRIPVSPAEQDLTADVHRVRVKHVQEIRPANRGLAISPTVVDAADDDVVELEFVGGIKQWISVAQLREDMANSGARSVDGSVPLPTRPVGAPGARGFLFDAGLKLAKLLGFDPVGGAAELVASKVVEQFEGKLKPFPGLYRLASITDDSARIKSADEIGADGPSLLFLHGTNSNISGSFGGINEEWSRLKKLYDNRIFALEHPTLSVSPIINALEVLKTLPKKAKLHLVTYSRGGLIGELLCIKEVKPEHLKAFEARIAARDSEVKLSAPEAAARQEARKREIACLKELADLLREKELEIDKFVRVACPARGTILASGRLDLYLSAITSGLGFLLGKVPVPGMQQAYDFSAAVVKEVARRRTRPEALPGYEAQMPESPLIHLLNGCGVESQANLAVIAGDIGLGGGFWSSLKVLMTDLFYWSDHDLVVNTDSMYRGLSRKKVWHFTESGAEISHFNYFTNSSSRSRLLQFLESTTDEPIGPEFQARARGEVRPAVSRGVPKRSDGQKPPLLIVLPGIMGTFLNDEGGRMLWFEQTRIGKEGMGALRLDAKGVAHGEVVGLQYQKLADHFAATHEVVLFGYDWRQSVMVAAARLKEQVEAHQKDGRQIQILAHSMGGLVARAMIAEAPALWDQLCEAGTRLIQLGTPNRGSYAIPRIFWGEEKTVEMLALVDPVNTRAQLCGIFAEYSGVLEMLPETPENHFFNPTWWQACTALARPAAAALGNAAQVRQRIAGGSTRNIIYVAGQSTLENSAVADTPSGLTLNQGAAVWEATADGDGTVSYALGLIEGVPTYYMGVIHGELANHEPAFPALRELLTRGETMKLTRTAPGSARGTDRAKRALRSREPVLFPEAEDIFRAALGASPVRHRRAEALPDLRVGVYHGDLRLAHHPVIVGHYRGDKIVHAEEILDQQLCGRLSAREKLGLYPGEVGTVMLVPAPECQPPGGIIIGLGEIGGITLEKVRAGVVQAALRYGLHLSELPETTRDGTSGPVITAGLSVLLLGTYGARALRTLDSVTAIVYGILEANRLLREAGLRRQVCFTDLHIVEVYETVAIRALYAAQQLIRRLPRDAAELQAVTVEPHLKRLGKDGEGRFLPPLSEYDSGWWPRIQITSVFNPKTNKPTGELEFSVPTDRAIVAETVTSSRIGLIDDLVAAIITSPDTGTNDAVNLFELLVPNDLKPRLLADADNAVLQVDSLSARIPWEILGRRSAAAVEIEYLALRMGLVRQFVTGNPQRRETPIYAMKAVIIGDTLSPFTPLPGAQAEAKLVAELLGRHHYECDPALLSQPDFFPALRAILAHDYRILHIAAHGLYDPDPENESGVVLGQYQDGKPRFLTTREIRQMPALPELVFLNCCFLGNLDREDEISKKEHMRRMRSTNRLSASVAEELMNKGVKAVVAAGWAVDDGAACTFAETFYEAMLQGECFGDAVLRARVRTQKDHPYVNTWSAYQCYGSPDFRLELHGGATGTTRTQRDSGVEFRFVSRTEYLHTIRALRAEISQGRKENTTVTAEDLRRLDSAMPDEWKDGEIFTELGLTWGELGGFDEAISFIETALGREDGSVSFRAIEQLANYEDRAAAKELSRDRDNPEVKERSQKRWESAENRLKKLLEFEQTSERWSLLGACYRRRADFVPVQEYTNWINKAADAYRRATEVSKSRGTLNPYPALHALTYEWIGGTSNRTLHARLDEVVAVIKDGLSAKSDFWTRIHEPDALLRKLLFNGDLAQADGKLTKAKEALEKAYDRVMSAGYTPRELNSVVSGITLIAAMLRHDGVTIPERHLLAKTLEDFAADLNVRHR